MTAVDRPRFVVLGASNLTRGFVSLVAHVRAAHAGPVEILAAHGRGRSYGLESRLLGVRELVSIGACGLWRELERPAPSTHALVCDVGNDLAYGVAPAIVAGWVENAVDRLLERGARVALVGLPIASLDRLGRTRFALARSLYFPGRPLELGPLLEAAHDLDARLGVVARARSLAFVPPDGAWFGLDPVHARFVDRHRMWSAYLRALDLEVGAVHMALGEQAALRLSAPAVRRLCGRELRRAQPCVRLSDGTSVGVW